MSVNISSYYLSIYLTIYPLFLSRFQEIAGQLESLLELPLKKGINKHLHVINKHLHVINKYLHVINTNQYAIVNEKETTYSLEVFATLSSCLNQCWTDGIYLSSLIHRFWKLTLQVLVGGVYFACHLFSCLVNY